MRRSLLVIAVSLLVFGYMSTPSTAAPPNYDSTLAGLTKLAKDSVTGSDVPPEFQEQPTETTNGQGFLGIADYGDAVTVEQRRAVMHLLPATYKYAYITRDDLVLSVLAWYNGKDRHQIVGVGYYAELTTADAAPASLQKWGAHSAGWDPTLDGWVNVAFVDAAGTAMSLTQQMTAGEKEGCNCVLVATAAKLIASTCGLFPPSPWRAACHVAGGAAEVTAIIYCEKCKGTNGVTLTPTHGIGYQTQDCPVSVFVVEYSENDPDGMRVGFYTKAPTNSITPPGAATNHYRSFAVEFECCYSDTKVYSTTGYVEFLTQDWGYANGQVTVKYPGAPC